MSYFDDASLVMIPSGYKTSKVYSVKPTDGNGDLTFSRSNDTATRVGPNGIEKVRTNIILQSNGFNTASWTKFGSGTGLAPVITANAGTAPDGTNNAFRVQFNCVGTTSSDRSILNQSRTSVNNTPHTSSVYIKAFSAGEVGKQVRFITEQNGSEIIITLTADWQRVVNVGTSVATSLNFLLETRGGFTTNTTADVLLAFAQLETGDIATDYIATTSSAVSVGPVANVPRLDYLGSSCPRLLLEPQRTNLAKFSEQFNNTSVWGGTATITANNAVSPDGYTNADSINPSSTAGRSLNNNSSPIAITAGTAYTISLFVKNNNFGASDYITFNTTDNVASELLGRIYPSLQTFSNTSATGSPAWSNISTNVVNYGNGWYRYSITATAGSNSGAAVTYLTLSKNCWFYGFQFEAGAYATSYIPTLGAAVTRGADAMTDSTFTALPNPNFTIFFEVDNWSGSDGNNYQFRFIPSSGARSIQFRNRTDGWRWFIVNDAGGSVYLNAGNTTYKKMACRYDGTNYQLFANGSAVGAPFAASDSLILTNLDYFAIGIMGVKQMLCFPTALSDADCIALTA